MWFFRYRLLTVLAIGIITSALSLTALLRVLSITRDQRRERALDAVTQQVERLRAAGSGGTAGSASARQALSAPAAGSMIGMRGGYVDASGTARYQDLPPEWTRPLAQVLKQSREQKGRAVYIEPLGSALLVLGAQPTDAGELAWAGLLLPPPHYWRFWMAIVVLLTLATALLVTTAISAVVSFRRSAAALNRCLLALAEDLATPVPRPRVLELVEVADGIRRLAGRLVQAREEQARLGQELSQKDRLAALGRVVAGVAHEVRNPLASIKLRLDLAAVDRTLPPAAELAIGHASSEIARLDRLVADLLMVAGRQVGPRGATALEALLRARIETLGPWAAQRGVTLSVHGAGTAVIDSESVARAVDNLLRNAVEASPAGAAVTAEVSLTATTCRVCISDRGAGIANSAELFEPFFTTKPDGTGLGLAISRAIARAHGGEVSYTRREPDPGSGEPARTCFELTLAREAPARPREAA